MIYIDFEFSNILHESGHCSMNKEVDIHTADDLLFKYPIPLVWTEFCAKLNEYMGDIAVALECVCTGCHGFFS